METAYISSQCYVYWSSGRKCIFTTWLIRPGPITCTRTPAPGIIKFRILVNHYYTFTFSESCPRVNLFYIFYCNIASFWGGRSWNLQFLFSLPNRCYILYLVKIGPVILEKKTLTLDQWRTTIGRQFIVTDPLSDLGDLKINRTYGWTEERRTTDGQYF